MCNIIWSAMRIIYSWMTVIANILWLYMLFITESINSKSWEDSWCILCAQFWSVMHSFWLFKSLRTHSTQFIYTFTVKVQTYHDVHPFYCIALFFQTQMKKWIPLNAWRNLHISLTEARWQWTPNPVAVTLHCHRHRINTAFYHPLLYCCFSPPIGLSSLLFQLFCVEGGCNLALPAIRGVDQTWTAARERLEVSVGVTNCFGRLEPISLSLECKLSLPFPIWPRRES